MRHVEQGENQTPRVSQRSMEEIIDTYVEKALAMFRVEVATQVAHAQKQGKDSLAFSGRISPPLNDKESDVMRVYFDNILSTESQVFQGRQRPLLTQELEKALHNQMVGMELNYKDLQVEPFAVGYAVDVTLLW